MSGPSPATAGAWAPTGGSTSCATVASALLGTVDIVARPDDLAADFRALTGAAMAKNVAELWLRLWTPQGATVRFLKQVAPAVEDLTDRRVEAGRQRGAYLLGAWGAESRDYHLCVDVTPGPVNTLVRAARVELVGGGSPDVLAQANVTAEWTDDVVRSSAIDPRVAHYTGQVALAAAVADGLAAREAGDVALAEDAPRARRCGSRRSRGTTTPRSCSRVSSRCSTRRPARSGCARTRTRRARWRSTRAGPGRIQVGRRG